MLLSFIIKSDVYIFHILKIMLIEYAQEILNTIIAASYIHSVAFHFSLNTDQNPYGGLGENS